MYLITEFACKLIYISCRNTISFCIWSNIDLWYIGIEIFSYWLSCSWAVVEFIYEFILLCFITLNIFGELYEIYVIYTYEWYIDNYCRVAIIDTFNIYISYILSIQPEFRCYTRYFKVVTDGILFLYSLISCSVAYFIYIKSLIASSDLILPLLLLSSISAYITILPSQPVVPMYCLYGTKLLDDSCT